MIRLRTLGQLALEQEDGTAIGSVLRQPKRLALLIYLAAAHPSGTRARDTLLALLWPELDDAHARTALRQALHTLRRALGPRAITGAGDERVGVDRGAVCCDVVSFDARLAKDPASALAIYRGPFLDGFHVSDAPEFERWVERERRRLEVEAVAAAWQLAGRAATEGDADASRRWAERALETAPWDELGLRRYLEILEAQSDAAAAVRVFETVRLRLAEDLGLEPSAETADLIDRIRAGGQRVVATEPQGIPPARSRAQELSSEQAPELHAEPAVASTTPGIALADRLEPISGTGPAHPHGFASRDGGLSRRSRRGVGLLAALSTVGIVAAALAVRSPPSAHQPASVAVLPFRSLSADSSQAFFAGALHEEIVDQLGRVSSLRVVGPAFIAASPDREPTLTRLGRDLGVGRLVEGSVEIVGSQLRVFVRLADASNGHEIWSTHYDRTLDDAFAVQTEIAESIAAAVGVTLTRTEDSAIRTPPSRDATAYRLYLQGVDYMRRPALRREDAVAARQLLERAVAIDTPFGPAHAALAMVNWREYALRYDRTPDRLALARQEAAAARRSAPDLANTHLATGLVEHMSRGDFDGALAEFRIAAHGAPNHPETWFWIGAVERSLGMWDSAFIAFDRARSLDPRDAVVPFAMGETHHYLHEYREAIDCYRQALALAPDMTQARLSMAWSYAMWQSQFDTLKAVLAGISTDDPGAGGSSVGGERVAVLMWEGKADSVLDILRSRAASGANPRSFAETVAEADLMRGDTAAARTAWREAEAFVDSLLTLNPDDPGLHGSRGVILGALGRREEALREARFIERTDAYRRDQYAEGWLVQARARVLAQAGDTDGALAEIEKALSHPSGLTVFELQRSMAYAPLRSNPRFRALVEKYADPRSVR